MSRFLLIITGDGTYYFTAPIDCESVAKVKDAITNCATHCLVNDRKAGTGLLALALRTRLLFPKDKTIFDGRKQFQDAYKGNEPLLTVKDLSFNLKIDPRKIISDKEYDLWTCENSENFSVENNNLYNVVILEDCL